ncbi:MAG: ABC transporter ATP-binding protein [Cumulibacter sp.]
MNTDLRTKEAAMPPHRPVLDIRDLSVTFSTARGEVQAVRGATLAIQPGQTVALVGESGSGKSTLAAVLYRLLAENAAITSGSVTFDGTDLLGISEKQMNDIRGKQIGLVPQDPMSNLDPLMTIGKQIAEVFVIHGVAKGKEATRRSIELLHLVGIDDPARRARQYPHEFSGGMRQRVLIAMALACQPTLLIADEPTSALDVTVQKLILDQLAELTASMGTTLLLVTHDLGLAGERADHMVVMNKGQIVESGPAAKILTDPQDDYTKRLIAAAPGLSTHSLVGLAPDGEPVIEASGITKRYRVRSGLLRRTDFTAVNNVSLSVRRGQTVGIVGESGSGKSTTAKLLLQLEGVTAGEMTFRGRAATRSSGEDSLGFRRQVQPVFQNPYASLDPRYSIGDAIREPLDVHRIGTLTERDARVVALLEQVALDGTYVDRYPHELSGGQRQRVAIARALALDPELVVLDEAVSALDVLVQEQILELLVDLQRRRSLSYVFISHDLAVIRMISHYVHVMRAGEVVESGTPQDIFENPQHEYTKNLLAAIPTTHP